MVVMEQKKIKVQSSYMVMQARQATGVCRGVQRWFPIPPTPTLHLMHGVPEEPPRRHTCHLPELHDGGSFYSIPEVTAELILT